MATLANMEMLRLSSNFAQSYVNYYVDFCMPPFLRKFQVEAMVVVAMKSAHTSQSSESQRVTPDVQGLVDNCGMHVWLQFCLTCVEFSEKLWKPYGLYLI